MMLSLSDTLAENWKFCKSEIAAYFKSRKLRLDLLASLWLNKEINLQFLKHRISNESAILESEINTVTQISKESSHNAATVALSIYAKELYKYNK